MTVIVRERRNKKGCFFEHLERAQVLEEMFSSAKLSHHHQAGLKYCVFTKCQQQFEQLSQDIYF